MPFFSFADLIEKHGMQPSKCRVLRHDQRGLADYRRGQPFFEDFVSYQNASRSPYANCKFAFHFVPGERMLDGSPTAIFAGAHEVLNGWEVTDGARLPLLGLPMKAEYGMPVSSWQRSPGDMAHDLKRLTEFDIYDGLLKIAWGPKTSAKAWSQYADRQPKPIIELKIREPKIAFPGYMAFQEQLNRVPDLEKEWRDALERVGGVYLLVAKDGRQYVGAAHGERGFFGRWCQHAEVGGDAINLQENADSYTVSILELHALGAGSATICERERFWMERLGSRVHGLN